MKNFHIHTPIRTTKKFLMKNLTFFFAFGLFFFTAHAVFAQSSIADVCGQTATSPKCQVGDLGPLVMGLVGLVVKIGLPVLFVVVSIRVARAWLAREQGNANAYKDALKGAGQSFLGFAFIVMIIGGLLYSALTFFGVKPEYLKILKLFADSGFFTHTYAATQLDNPTTITSLYDFILKVLRLVMRFFVYPALIVIWVWTGFSFILAQGNPEGLTKAKKLLTGAFITTIIIAMLQGFLVALQGTVNKIIPTATSTTKADANYSNEGKNAQPIDVNNVNYSNEVRVPSSVINTTYGNEGKNAQPIDVNNVNYGNEGRNR